MLTVDLQFRVTGRDRNDPIRVFYNLPMIIRFECARRGHRPDKPWHVICTSPVTRATRVPFVVGPLHYKENIMGKYFLAWLLGVPMFVLVIVYIFFH